VHGPYDIGVEKAAVGVQVVRADRLDRFVGLVFGPGAVEGEADSGPVAGFADSVRTMLVSVLISEPLRVLSHCAQ